MKITDSIDMKLFNDLCNMGYRSDDVMAVLKKNIKDIGDILDLLDRMNRDSFKKSSVSNNNNDIKNESSNKSLDTKNIQPDDNNDSESESESESYEYETESDDDDTKDTKMKQSGTKETIPKKIIPKETKKYKKEESDDEYETESYEYETDSDTETNDAKKSQNDSIKKQLIDMGYSKDAIEFCLKLNKFTSFEQILNYLVEQDKANSELSTKKPSAPPLEQLHSVKVVPLEQLHSVKVVPPTAPHPSDKDEPLYPILPQIVQEVPSYPKLDDIVPSAIPVVPVPVAPVVKVDTPIEKLTKQLIDMGYDNDIVAFYFESNSSYSLDNAIDFFNQQQTNYSKLAKPSALSLVNIDNLSAKYNSCRGSGNNASVEELISYLIGVDVWKQLNTSEKKSIMETISQKYIFKNLNKTNNIKDTKDTKDITDTKNTKDTKDITDTKDTKDNKDNNINLQTISCYVCRIPINDHKYVTIDPNSNHMTLSTSKLEHYCITCWDKKQKLSNMNLIDF